MGFNTLEWNWEKSNLISYQELLNLYSRAIKYFFELLGEIIAFHQRLMKQERV